MSEGGPAWLLHSLNDILVITICGFVCGVDPVEFSRCFARWMRGISKVTDGQLVALDGKALRRSFDTAAEKSAIHMVSA